LAQVAGRALVDYGFGLSGVKGIFAGHHPKNEASKNMIEKLGFRYTHDEIYSPTGVAHSCYLLMKPIVGERVRGED
jgi:RimJ/RimL family protein N-acetyltransferase